MSPFLGKNKLLPMFLTGLFSVFVFSPPCTALEGEVIMDAPTAGLVQFSQQDTALRNSMRYAAEAILYDSPEESVPGGSGFNVSGGIGYFSHSVDAGGDIDLDGASGLVTMSYHKPGSPVFYGIFGELFDGEYDTFRLTAEGEASSYGSLESYGIGLFAQYRPYLAETGAPPAVWIPGLYLDASVRIGHGKMDFKSPKPEPFKFNVSGMYYGASAGAGYVFEVSPKAAVDVYGRLVWTAMGSMDAGTCQGDGVFFERADSLRLVSGFRAGYMASERVRPYIGMALDWELMDGPEAYFECVRVGESDMSGISGLFEIGVNWKARGDVFVNLNVSGSVGQRESFGGTIEVKYTF